MTDPNTDARNTISRAAERMRQSRARRREGFFTVLVDVHESDVERMIELGLLPATDAADLNAIGSAVSNIVGDFLGTT